MGEPQGSQHYRAYIELLRQLRGLIAEGKGESDEADRLRDKMDEPWLHLTAEEVVRVDAVAAEGDVPLTQEEMDILHTVHGISKDEITKALLISDETVNKRVQRILRKIANSDRTRSTISPTR